MKTENTNKRFFFACLLIVGLLSMNVGVTGLPPTTFSGFLDSLKNTAFNLFVPNYQATKTTSGILLETGNKNLLINPSFEHSTVDSSWTVTNSGALVTQAETSVIQDGKKAYKLSPSSASFELYQDSTLYQAQFADGVQGLGYIRVKTSVSGIKVCARQAGTTSTTLCVSVQSNGKWGLYKVPFILGGTSNGLSVTSNGVAVTGDIYVDDAFLGAVDLKVDGPSIVTQTASWAAGTTTTGQVFSGTPTTSGSGNFTFSSGTITALRDIDVSMACSGTTSGSFTIIVQITAAGVSRQVDNTVVGVGNNASTSWHGKLAQGQTAYCSNTSGNTASSGAVDVVARNIVNSSTYSSTNADTDWAACQFSTLAWQGLGTITNNLLCKRQGGDLLISGKIVLGTVTSSEARYLLPVWSGVQLVAAGSSKVASSHIAGRLTRAISSTVTDYAALVNASQNYLTSSYQGTAGANNPTTAMTGLSQFNTGETVVFENIRIPIEGWENSNVIIGQFNGLENCTDSYQCTDTYSALVSSAGVVSGENIDWITGNCAMGGTNSATATCTFKSGLFTVNPNCVVQTQGQDYYIFGSANSTQAQYITQSSGGVFTPQTFYIMCQKAGADFIGKTAKAVASDQNDRTVGMVKWSSHLVKYDGGGDTTNCAASPCTTTELTGDWVNGNVTRSTTGVYSLTTQAVWSPNTWVLCYASYMVNASPNNSNDGAPIASIKSDSTGVITFIPRAWNAGGSAFDSYGIIKCEGQLK